MSDNINLEFLGAHITRLRADMSDVRSELARLTSDEATILNNVTALSLKVAQMERALGDCKSYVDLRTVELLKYGLGTIKEELTSLARQPGRIGS